MPGEGRAGQQGQAPEQLGRHREPGQAPGHHHEQEGAAHPGEQAGHHAGVIGEVHKGGGHQPAGPTTTAGTPRTSRSTSCSSRRVVLTTPSRPTTVTRSHEEAGAHRGRDHHRAPRQEGDGRDELGQRHRGRPPGQPEGEVAEPESPERNAGRDVPRHQRNPRADRDREAAQGDDLLDRPLPPPPEQPALHGDRRRAPERRRSGRRGPGPRSPGRPTKTAVAALDSSQRNDRSRTRAGSAWSRTAKPPPTRAAAPTPLSAKRPAQARSRPVVHEDEHQAREGERTAEVAQRLSDDREPGRRTVDGGLGPRPGTGTSGTGRALSCSRIASAWSGPSRPAATQRSRSSAREAARRGADRLGTGPEDPQAPRRPRPASSSG